MPPAAPPPTPTPRSLTTNGFTSQLLSSCPQHGRGSWVWFTLRPEYYLGEYLQLIMQVAILLRRLFFISISVAVKTAKMKSTENIPAKNLNFWTLIAIFSFKYFCLTCKDFNMAVQWELVTSKVTLIRWVFLRTWIVKDTDSCTIEILGIIPSINIVDVVLFSTSTKIRTFCFSLNVIMRIFQAYQRYRLVLDLVVKSYWQKGLQLFLELSPKQLNECLAT